MSTWVVVADASQARILDFDEGELDELEVLEHPRARLHDSTIASDRPGRERNPGGGRHGMAGSRDPHDHEAVVFAKEVADRLERARVAGEVDRLVVMAAPKFLGRLRNEFSAPLRDLVIEDVDKDVAHVRTHDLPKHLPAALTG